MAVSPLADNDGVVGVTVLIAGEPLEETTELTSVRVLKEIGRIPKATVVLSDGDVATREFPLTDSDANNPGQDVEIKAGFGGNTYKTIFQGVITAQRLRIGSSGSPQLELTCRDEVISTNLVRSVTYFKEKKDSEVLSSIFSDAGITATVAASSDQARDQVQYDCTDWDFARAVCDRNGYVLIAEDGKVSAEKPANVAAVLKVTLGEDLTYYDVETDALDQVKGTSTKSWDVASQTVKETTGAQFSAPEIGTLKAADLASAVKDPEFSMFLAASMDSSNPGTPADARMQRAELARIRGTVAFPGSALAKPGSCIELVGLSDKFSGDGYVSAVRHDIRDGNWTTEATLGLDPEWRSDSSALSGAAAAGFTAPAQGLQIGVVTKLTESPDKEPKIEVALPLLGDDTKLWARYAAPYAGKGIGFMMLPEIGDEVILGFLAEHPDYPVILGSMHSSANTRPGPEVTKTNDTKTFVSREGLTLTFDEEKKSVLLETPNGQMIQLDDEEDTITLKDKHGNTIVMKDAGIALDSASDISLKAAQNITIEAGADCTVSGMNVTASADTAFSASGQASSEVTSGGQLKIQGSIVQIN